MLKEKLLSYLDLEAALLKVEENWKAGPDGFRQNLRAELATALTDKKKFPGINLSQTEKASLADLTNPPDLRFYSVSISHCPLAGGFVICPIQDGLVGLDLEDRTKVTREIVTRMGNEIETLQAPDPALLWAAKEATFKSLLKASQPSTLGQIQLTNWYTIEPHIWGFHAQIQGVSGPPILGLAAFEQNLVLGLAKFTP